MVKYVKEDTSVVFSEIPDEVTLAINISNCPHHCKGCHSPYLRKDIGEELTTEVLDELIKKNDGITCVCFMGEGNDVEGIIALALYVKQKYGVKYKLALYYGGEFFNPTLYHLDSQFAFDYIKVGPYKEECGPINKKTTNQKLYRIVNRYIGDNCFGTSCYEYTWIDITDKFWK